MPLFGDAFTLGRWCMPDIHLGGHHSFTDISGDTHWFADILTGTFEDSCWEDDQTPHDGVYRAANMIVSSVDDRYPATDVYSKTVPHAACCPSGSKGILYEFPYDFVPTPREFGVGSEDIRAYDFYVPYGSLPFWDEGNFSFGVWARQADSGPAHTVYHKVPTDFREATFYGGVIASTSLYVDVIRGWQIEQLSTGEVVYHQCGVFGSTDFSVDMGGLGDTAWHLFGFSVMDGHVYTYMDGAPISSIDRVGNAVAQRISFGHRDATGGAADHEDLDNIFNGGFGAPFLLSRGLTQKEWGQFFNENCLPVGKLKAKFRVFVTNDAPPQGGGSSSWSGNTDPSTSHNGDTQTVQTVITGGTIRVPYPPQGEHMPEYTWKRGAHLYRDRFYGAGCSGFGVEVWASDVWQPLYFMDLGAIDNRCTGIANRALAAFLAPSGGIYYQEQWNGPQWSPPQENPEWIGPAGVTDTDIGFGPTGITPTWPHWLVSAGDDHYDTWAPPLASTCPGSTATAGGDGYTFHRSDLFDTGYLDTSWVLDNAQFTFDGTFGFRTDENTPNPPFPGNLWSSDLYSIQRGHEIFGQLLFPSYRDYGFGYRWNNYKNKKFQVRVRETVTNTVISHHARTGYDMGFFTTPTLDMCGGALTFGENGVLGGEIGSDAWTLVPYGRARIPAGRRFVVEVHQNTGDLLEHPIWGFFHLVSMEGGDLAHYSLKTGERDDTSHNVYPLICA